MAARWRRIGYLIFWLGILAWVLTADWRLADGEAQAVVLTFLVFLTMPVSSVILCAFFVIHWLFPDAEQVVIEGINGHAVAVGEPEWFKIRFSIWWLMLVSASYWQWFWLAPKLLSSLRHWISRSDNPARPSETSPP